MILLCLGTPALADQGPKWGITVDGNPPPLVVRGSEPGQQPEPVEDASTLLSYQAHPARWSTYRIRAALDETLPPGVTLEVRLGSGSYKVLPVLPAEPVTLVEGITRKAVETLPIAYRLTVGASAGVVDACVRQVTFYWEEELE